MRELKNVTVFRTGTWNGDPYNEGDLDNIVKNFEKLGSMFLVPLKLKHIESKASQKEVGWVTGLKREEDKLVAKLMFISVKMYELMKKNLSKISAEIFPVWDDGFGNKYKMVLRAVSILDEEIPAVKLEKEKDAKIN